MTVKEAVKILAILKAAYPKDYPYNMSIDDAKVSAIVWARQFIDIPYDIVDIAVNKIISKDEKPCTVAKVKKEIGGLYWEAKEELDRADRAVKHGFKYPLDEKQKQLYEYIKKETYQYKNVKAIEPSIAQLVGTEEKLLLGGG